MQKKLQQLVSQVGRYLVCLKKLKRLEYVLLLSSLKLKISC